MGEIDKYSERIFEQYRHVNEFSEDFWYARDLQVVLQYTEWRNFIKVIDKAKIACESSGNNALDHFVDVNKMIDLAKGAKREIDDIMLSHYACYLIVQNADPK